MNALPQPERLPALPRRRWFRFRRLPIHEQRLLCEALVLLPLNKLALRVIGYRRWHAVLSAFLPRDPQQAGAAGGSSAPAPRRVAQLVHAASRDSFQTGACLERALALWWLLRRRHFPAELRLGARRRADKFEAHAWVQLDGVALNDEEALLQYAPFKNPDAGIGENLTGKKF